MSESLTKEEEQSLREAPWYQLSRAERGLLLALTVERAESARAADLSSALETERRDGTYYRSTAGVLAERVARLREAVRLAIAFQRPLSASATRLTDEATRHLLERARVETSADLVAELRRVLAETGGEP